MDQVSGGTPRVQDYSSYVVPFKQCPTCFQSTTTVKHSDIMRKKNQALEKSVKKERRVKCRNSPYVLSNHVFDAGLKLK